MEELNTTEQAEPQEDRILPLDAELWLLAKLQKFRDGKAYGRLEFKIQDGYIHTYHCTESQKARKRRRPMRQAS